jgi:sugar lactone lactonase YvrE
VQLHFECLAEARCEVGESPVWDGRENRLYWSDNESSEIQSIDLSDKRRQMWRMPDRIGSLGLIDDGRLLVAIGRAVHVFDPANGRSERFAEVPLPDGVDKLNDGKVGPDGAFWVGSMAQKEPDRKAVASLYRITPDGQVEEKIRGGIKVSNGLAWSADASLMFHSDSRGPWIDVWDFDAVSGAISNSRRIGSPDWDTGVPDGAATDLAGHYWSAGFSAQRLNLFTADGALAGSIAMPAAPTMPCFGGEDMKTLFVTTLRAHIGSELLAKYPLTGSVFMARTEVAGVPVKRFPLS